MYGINTAYHWKRTDFAWNSDKIRMKSGQYPLFCKRIIYFSGLHYSLIFFLSTALYMTLPAGLHKATAWIVPACACVKVSWPFIPPAPWLWREHKRPSFFDTVTWRSCEMIKGGNAPLCSWKSSTRFVYIHKSRKICPPSMRNHFFHSTCFCPGIMRPLSGRK